MKLMQTQNSAGHRPKMNANPRARAGRTVPVPASTAGQRSAACGVILALLALLSAPGAARAQDPGSIPAAINYQGRLTASDGSPVPGGYYEVGFRIWDNPTQAGAANYIWGRTFPLNVVTNGIFNVLLTDDGSPLALSGSPPSVSSLLDAFQSPTRYLGLSVSRNPQGQITSPVEISPRQQLVTAPFAIHSYQATLATSAGFATNAAQAAFALGAGSSHFMATNGLQAGGNTILGGSVTLNGTVTVPDPGSTFNGGFVPLGGIIMWSGTKVPAGWALCDGSRTNNILTPNLQGRFVLGAGSGAGLTPRALTDSPGGAETHTNSQDEMASHSHTRTTHTVGYQAMWDNGTMTATAAPNQAKNMQSQSYTSDPTGGGKAYSTMPPYFVLAYIIRVQ